MSQFIPGPLITATTVAGPLNGSRTYVAAAGAAGEGDDGAAGPAR